MSDESQESLYAVSCRQNVLGVMNQAYVDAEALPDKEDVPPKVPPRLKMSGEYQKFVKNSPLYMNQCGHVPTTDTGLIDPPAVCGKRRQPKQNEFEDNTGYSSCNDVTLARERLRDACFALVPTSANFDYEDNENEKGGYLQPEEVFNNRHAVKSGENDLVVSTRHTITQTVKEERTLQSEGNLRSCVDDDIIEENGYMCPTDPSVENDNEFMEVGVDIPRPHKGLGFGSNTYTGIPTRQDFHRFDSGVEDCESGRGSSPSVFALHAPFRTRLSTFVEQHYEDIDMYMNERKREKLRKSANQEANVLPVDAIESTMIHRPPGSSTDRKASGVELSTNSSLCQQVVSPSHRVRVDVTTNDRSSHKSQWKTRGRECYILVGVILVLSLLSTVSLGISITVLTFQNQTPNDDNHTIQRPMAPVYMMNSTTKNASGWAPELLTSYTDTKDHLRHLKQELHRFKKENIALKQSIHEQNKHIEDRLDSMMSTQNNVSLELGAISSSVDAKIANLTSITQGFPRMNDSPSCELKLSSFSSLSTHGVSLVTTYEPTEEELETNYVLFAFCAFMGMVDVNMEVQAINSHVQYRCRCKGTESDTNRHKVCTLYYWLCPRHR